MNQNVNQIVNGLFLVLSTLLKMLPNLEAKSDSESSHCMDPFRKLLTRVVEMK